MKFKKDHLKLLGLLLAVGGLFAFSGHRNAQKKIAGIDINFVGDQQLFITEEAVNKLLIQKCGDLQNQPKEKLVLNTIEEVVAANGMVKTAQVYLAVNGVLTVNVGQRKPIGRVKDSLHFYLDDQGKRMPLSSYYSARVPIVTGVVSDRALEDVYAILSYVGKDRFLEMNVIGVQIMGDGRYALKTRMEDFTVTLGKANALDKKFGNFKAFYAKAMKDGSLGVYSVVSLEFDNQVVCTKI